MICKLAMKSLKEVIILFDTALLRGVYAPIATPFDDDQHVLIDVLKNNIEKYNHTSLKGYMPLGSNGEYQSLTDGESLRILTEVCRYKSKDKTIVAGCGRESAYKTIEFIKQASDCGLDVAFILPPHYFVEKMTDEALDAYYTYIADYSRIPIIIYNAPKFACNILISELLMCKLSKHPNIIAMKNSSPHPNAEYIKAIDPNTEFSLIAGNIGTFYSGLLEGAIGCVLSTASYLPEYCCRLYEHFILGEYEKAFDIHMFLTKISSDTIGLHGVAGLKLAMDIRGFYGGRVRVPLLNITDFERKRISKYFEENQISRFSYC